MTGYTFYTSRKDIFIETDRKRKTDALARETIDRINALGWSIPNVPEMRKQLLGLLKKADCEYTTLPSGTKFVTIHGDNFSVSGFADDDSILVLTA